MGGLFRWPPAILRRWLGLPVVGLGCLLAGAAVGIALKDRFMLFLSVAVFLACVVKAIVFYRLVARGEYEVVEGICVEVKRQPIQKSCRVKVVDSADNIRCLTLEKRLSFRVGRQYRFYLRKNSGISQPSSPFSRPDELLGYEEVEPAEMADEAGNNF
jgi:hypothetical protein